jgi:hypothetical protein
LAGLPAGGAKDPSRAEAARRFPEHVELFARKSDHDRSDAVMIGLAGLRFARNIAA